MWALVWMWACAGAPPSPSCDEPTDTATRFTCGGELTLTVGTGEVTWEELADGVLPLVRGSQGAQHVPLSLRLAVDPETLVVDRATATITPRRSDDGAVIEPFALGVGLAPAPEGVEAIGVRVVFPDAGEVVGRTMEIAVSVAPVGLGGEGRAVVRGVVTWAGSP